MHGVSAAQGDPVRIGRQNGSQNGSQNTTQNGRGIQAASFSACPFDLPPTRGLPLAARLLKPLPCRPLNGTVETRAADGSSAPEEVAVRIATQHATRTTQNERGIRPPPSGGVHRLGGVRQSRTAPRAAPRPQPPGQPSAARASAARALPRHRSCGAAAPARRPCETCPDRALSCRGRRRARVQNRRRWR